MVRSRWSVSLAKHQWVPLGVCDSVFQCGMFVKVSLHLVGGTALVVVPSLKFCEPQSRDIENRGLLSGSDGKRVSQSAGGHVSRTFPQCLGEGVGATLVATTKRLFEFIFVAVSRAWVTPAHLSSAQQSDDSVFGSGAVLRIRAVLHLSCAQQGAPMRARAGGCARVHRSCGQEHAWHGREFTTTSSEILG